MKKLISAALVVTMLAGSLVGCSKSAENTGSSAASEVAIEATSESTDSEAATKEAVAWKVGLIDPGPYNATSGPLFAQLELTINALNGTFTYVTMESNSAEATINAVKNLIAADVDAIILSNQALKYGCMAEVADLCEESEVYWSMFWTKIVEGEPNYEACMNKKYFVSTTFEDDVESAYFCTSTLGKLGVKNICEIGFPSGNTTGDMRDAGINKALDEFGMKLLAAERDETVTRSAEGGAIAGSRFLSSYPEMDGIVVAGMSQYVLSGLVETLKSQKKGIDDIQVAAIDFHEFQKEYLEEGYLDAIIGGHIEGPTYSAILIANRINGTSLSEEPMLIQDNFIKLSSKEEAERWDEYVAEDGYIYSPEEIANCLVVNNPDFNLEVFQKMIDDYSLEDIVARR